MHRRFEYVHIRASIGTVYAGIPVQRCRAHKIRNVTGKVRKADHKAVRTTDAIERRFRPSADAPAIPGNVGGGGGLVAPVRRIVDIRVA